MTDQIGMAMVSGSERRAHRAWGRKAWNIEFDRWRNVLELEWQQDLTGAYESYCFHFLLSTSNHDPPIPCSPGTFFIYFFYLY